MKIVRSDKIRNGNISGVLFNLSWFNTITLSYSTLINGIIDTTAKIKVIWLSLRMDKKETVKVNMEAEVKR